MVIKREPDETRRPDGQAGVVRQEGAVTRMQALRYRVLRHVDVAIGPYQVLVGPNGSGKSTFMDIPAFLADLLAKGPADAALAVRHDGTARTLDPMDLCWGRRGGRFEIGVELAIPKELSVQVPAGSRGPYRTARYEVAIRVDGDDGGLRVETETLWLLPDSDHPRRLRQRELFPQGREPPRTIVREERKKAPPGWRKVVWKTRDNDYFRAETSGWNAPFRIGAQRSVLANLPEDERRFPVATWARRILRDHVQPIAVSVPALRRGSPPGRGLKLLPDAANLPWVVETFRRRHPERHRWWIDHLRTAIPDLADVEVAGWPDGRIKYLVARYANGLRVPAWLVSDGTLRLIALTLLAYLPEIDGLILVEEPENGIHPRAVEAVYQSLSQVEGAQVLYATHSPLMLGLAPPNEILCFALDANGAADVIRGDRHPRLRRWRGEVDLGSIFAAGVLG